MTQQTTSSNNLFRKHKLAIATSLLLGSMGTYMLSSAPLSAESNAIPTATAPVAIAGTLPELSTMIKQNRSAVVSIRVEHDRSNSGHPKIDSDRLSHLPKEFRDFFRGSPQMPHGDSFKGRKSQSHGSGFIISADGYVVTNAHVIDDASKVTVSLDDKREFNASVVGVDKLSDIALLKVDASNLPAVALGNSDQLDVGQWVVAIGAPFGLDYTATQGIVSALSRSLPSETYVPFIQTDAAVNPGNSGGPLFNLQGQVIGVNSQIYSRHGGYMGVSFAIPINIVKNVTDQLRNNGQVSRGWLGVGIQGIDQDLAQSFGLKNANGSLVTSVESGSPAEKAGLQSGDIIANFDNKPVKSVNDLPLLVGSTPIGKEVPITVWRLGVEKSIQVTIDQLAGKDETPVLASLEKGSLGVAVSALSKEERVSFNLKNKGVKVEKVLSNSPAETAGLQSGDIILAINGKGIESPSALKRVIKKQEGNKPLAVLFKRGDVSLFVAVHLNS